MARDVKFLWDEFATIKVINQLYGGQEKYVQTDAIDESTNDAPTNDESTSTSNDQTSEQQKQVKAAKVIKRRGTNLVDIDEENILDERLRNRTGNNSSTLMAMALIAIGNEPQTYREAAESSDSDKWMQAMKDEHNIHCYKTKLGS